MSALGGAKAQSLVGEQADGYLGVVSNSGQAADIAAQINHRARRIPEGGQQQRRFAGRRGGHGRQEGDGENPAGQYVQVGGKWVKK